MEIKPFPDSHAYNAVRLRDALTTILALLPVYPESGVIAINWLKAEMTRTPGDNDDYQDLKDMLECLEKIVNRAKLVHGKVG